MSILLIRYRRTESITRGVLIVGNTYFHTLEPSWHENKRNVSCIPRGEYDISFLPRSASGKYKNVYRIKNVPNRSGILIHNGNIRKHTRGCILIGKKAGTIGKEMAVLQSRTALKEFVELLKNQDEVLRII